MKSLTNLTTIPKRKSLAQVKVKNKIKIPLQTLPALLIKIIKVVRIVISQAGTQNDLHEKAQPPIGILIEETTWETESSRNSLTTLKTFIR